MLSVLRSRAVHGPLLGVSFLAFMVAVYAHGAWVQNLSAALGVGCVITGCAGLWARRRTRRSNAPEG